ncbi:MAG: hypothetical protein JWL65_4686 [Gammaproteobacteria bacterium]|nr:hypothetical protein [Gammaproteobacteria bacterium]
MTLITSREPIMRKIRPAIAARTTQRWSQRCCAALLVGSTALWTLPSYAHHSFAAYDQKITKTVAGTLKEFDWNAPHSGMTVVYMNEQGAVAEVSVTTGSPSVISGQGFKPKDFRLGAKVTLSWHPNRNGLPGGELVELKLEDGRVLHGGFPPPPGTKSEIQK